MIAFEGRSILTSTTPTLYRVVLYVDGDDGPSPIMRLLELGEELGCGALGGAVSKVENCVVLELGQSVAQLYLHSSTQSSFALPSLSIWPVTRSTHSS